MKRTLTLILSLILLAQAAFAEKQILIRSETAKLDDFQAFLKAESNFIDYSQFRVKFPVAREMSQSLIEKLERSQSLYLGGEIEQAITAFTETVALLHQADWVDAEREALFFSLLKLYQLTQNESWLERAIDYAPDLTPAKENFSPQFQNDFQAIKRKLIAKNLKFTPENNWRDFETVLFDGRQFQVSPNLEIDMTPGEHRLTLISNVYKPVSRIISRNEIFDFKPQRIPFSEESCEEFKQLRTTFLPHSKSAVFFNMSCVKSLNGESYLQTVVPQYPVPPTLPTYNLSATAPRVEKSKTWLWIAAGVVISAGVYALLANQNNKKGGPQEVPPQ
jgi:hypothetical protein